MNFIYHLVPKDMRGDILYPLNKLNNVYPDLFKKAAKKYEGRELLRELRIPVLDCLWNDVLHFTAVHPKKIKNALAEAGIPIQRSFECFEIDPKAFEAENTIVFLYQHRKREDFLNEENFEKYNPSMVPEFNS
jgi:hypothetical protein